MCAYKNNREEKGEDKNDFSSAHGKHTKWKREEKTFPIISWSKKPHVWMSNKNKSWTIL